MSCYLRYMKEFLDETNLNTETRPERKELDLAIRKVVGMKAEDKCNIVWKEVKVWLQDEDKKKQLIKELNVS